MEWHHLGHACWLVEAAGLRMLFDPLVAPSHHGGVFDLHPRRTLDVAALSPDFVFVSHRHPDHFDLSSLRALAAHDPDIVVVTPDPLVERCARRLGFREVRVLGAGTQVSLDGARFVTTPSIAETVEWGVMVGCDDAVTWNEVDTVHASVEALRETIARSLAALDARALSLACVRWQPLREIEAQLGARTAFPYRAYGDVLEQIAAMGARAIVPASAGACHAAPFARMNRFVYPVPEARFLRDVAARLPEVRAFPAITGATFHVAGSDVACDPRGARGFLAALEDEERPDPRAYRPFLEVEDPNLDGRDASQLRAVIERWVRERLAPSLVRRDQRCVLEVVLPSTRDAFTITTRRGEARVERRFDEDWDALVSVAGSLLVDVVEGRRHWGDPLLAGALSAATRAYEVDARGLRVARVPPIFLYEALGYDESVERSLEHALG